MDNQTCATITAVFERVLEQFVFAFCEWVPKEELPPDGAPFLRASLVFSGSQCGEISITMPSRLCEELAGNILGLPPEADNMAEYGKDSMKEFLNVLAGNVLTALYGEDAVFHIGAPIANCMEEGEWQAWVNDPLTVGVLIEDQPALLRFTAEEKK